MMQRISFSTIVFNLAGKWTIRPFLKGYISPRTLSISCRPSFHIICARLPFCRAICSRACKARIKSSFHTFASFGRGILYLSIYVFVVWWCASVVCLQTKVVFVVAAAVVSYRVPVRDTRKRQKLGWRH